MIRAFKGKDQVSGGGGPDVIRTVDDRKDVVGCGAGRDKAIVDKRDDVSSCEKLIER